MAHSFWLPTEPASNTKAMRTFAFGFSLLCILVFCAVLPWLFSHSIPLWPLYLSGALSATAIVYAKAVYPFYRLWMLVASVVGWLNTRLIMLLAFYGLILPIGVVLRMLGKLQYAAPVTHQQQVNSYWQKRERTPDKDNLKEPF